jgi:hypothetical protein
MIKTTLPNEELGQSANRKLTIMKWQSPSAKDFPATPGG